MSANTSIFEVDEASDLPIWVQLRNRIAYLIRTGRLKGGEQLPSIRSLAADAKINYNTVTKAYRDLELEKLIVSVRGRGMYVQKNLTAQGEQKTLAIDAVLEDCVQQYRSLGMTFDEIDDHVRAITDSMRSEARSAAEERTIYYDAE
ncbi:GntR family transcriptional regulator [Gordonibacter massiliensis (ex Traore et al. 2017)]|uniref:GntR family transcriptional regulator n=1 Tax=Gordonibacter massiliensis (ex Traore et al. 2017) TaxID=1841863 RepID=A0A842JEE8_9ACTN|nr:GntR family transcriptional regulator [Gordonibacter massiliensis (ex Traore et al. 2017)]MBC2888338.1 GntR family transcriptional regulator [Gordonibacter massiliensis (ex Traore et al. 2017)]